MAGLSYSGLITQIRNYTEVDSNVLSADQLENIIYEETLPNGKKYLAAYNKKGTLQNSDKYVVPQNLKHQLKFDSL